MRRLSRSAATAYSSTSMSPSRMPAKSSSGTRSTSMWIQDSDRVSPGSPPAPASPGPMIGSAAVSVAAWVSSASGTIVIPSPRRTAMIGWWTSRIARPSRPSSATTLATA